MNDYQNEQLMALVQVKEALGNLGHSVRAALETEVIGYIEFRRRLDSFLKHHFGGYCTAACYQNQRSACCGRDAIIVFWADVVVNALRSTEKELAAIAAAIQRPSCAQKCIFLADRGCLWQVRPLLCAMFLCDDVVETVVRTTPGLDGQWEALQSEAKSFRWPDRPVLFDKLEGFFMDLGCRSTLMHLNTSPGLLRLKRLSGLIPPERHARRRPKPLNVDGTP